MDAAQALYRRSGFRPLCGPLGGTGHFSCDQFFIRDL
jgi:putative acetyltransferase